MLYRAHLVTPTDSQGLLDLPDGGMRVDAEGRIRAVGPFEALAEAHPLEEILDLRPCWILPGLLDLHSHLPQHEAVAIDGLPLLPWLEHHIFPAELAFRDPALAGRAARIYFQDQLALGTTTAAVYCTIHPEATHHAFVEAERSGIRVVMGKVMMDRFAPEGLTEKASDSLAQSRELCQAWHGRDAGRIQYAFTPRFAPSCSAELLAGAGRLAREHEAYVQTHVSENLDEVAWVRSLFPECRNYTDVYAQAGLLGPRTLLGHGIHLGPEERQAIRAAGATIVHCPRSNAFLRSGIMPLSRWLGEGLQVGLGTDVGAGPSLDLWAEMAFACMASKLNAAGQQNMAAALAAVTSLSETQKEEVSAALSLVPETPIDPLAALRLATLDGAKALGLGHRIGSLETGKEADFIVVDPRRAAPAPAREGLAPEEPTALVLSRLLYRSAPAMVRATYVRGRRCHSEA